LGRPELTPVAIKCGQLLAWSMVALVILKKMQRKSKPIE